MKLRALILLVALLAGLESWAWWKSAAQRQQAGSSSLVDSALLDPSLLERSRRIVIREKPQVKVVSRGKGFEVSLVPDKDAPIRETILERHGGRPWVVANYFGLDADPAWLGQTMRDLSQGRLVRHVASDAKLMDDLELDIAQVRLEDEKGRVLRRLDFGRKDGDDAHQFVRVNEGDAFVAKHEAEIVGDPLTWIVGQIFRFAPGEVREVEMPLTGANEAPVLLRRAAPGAALLPVDPAIPAPERVAQNAERILGKLLDESVMLAVDRHAPVAETARRHIAARLRLTLFDGREYRISYGIVPKDDPAAADLRDYGAVRVTFVFCECSDPQDMAARYNALAALGYNRSATLGRLPENREALSGATP